MCPENKIPTLLSGNEEAAAIYMLTRHQVVTKTWPSDEGMKQLIDLSIPAVKIAMDLYGVQDQRTCLERVRSVFHHFEAERRKHAG